MEKELKEAVKMVNEQKDEISKFVKNFLEKEKTIIEVKEPFFEEVEYSIKTTKWGEINLKFFKEEGFFSVPEYVYSIWCKELNIKLIQKIPEYKANCDLYLSCNYKVSGLEEEYKRWGVIKL